MGKVWIIDIKDQDIQLPEEIMDFLKIDENSSVTFHSIAPKVLFLRKTDPDQDY